MKNAWAGMVQSEDAKEHAKSMRRECERACEEHAKENAKEHTKEDARKGRHKESITGRVDVRKEKLKKGGFCRLQLWIHRSYRILLGT